MKTQMKKIQMKKIQMNRMSRMMKNQMKKTHMNKMSQMKNFHYILNHLYLIGVLLINFLTNHRPLNDALYDLYFHVLYDRVLYHNHHHRRNLIFLKYYFHYSQQLNHLLICYGLMYQLY